MARGGPRPRAGPEGAADRGRLDPVLAKLAPTWRLHGCHAGRREVEDNVGRNGRGTAAANGGANHGDTGESEHTGWLHETRGDKPTARIRRREFDGGGLRRRHPAAREEGNGDGVTGDQFGDLSGLGPGKRRKTMRPKSPSRVLRTHRLSRCLAMNGGGETEGRQWRGGGERNGRRNRWEGGVTPAEETREKGEKGGLAPCHFGKKRRERGRRGRGRRSSTSIPWKLARGVAGPGRDDGDDGEGGLERSGDTGGRRGLRSGRGLTAAATGRSATTACARAREATGSAAIWAASAGTAAIAEREGEALGAAHAHARAAHGQSEGGEREKEREREKDGPRGNRSTEPEGGKIDFSGRIEIRDLNLTMDWGFEIWNWHGN
uniref:DUF591 domain-containing protein n=1 Tax=Oryza sativa subsp. japonica TaxID=39947 RepID=Q8S6Z8_ORYSJ|nr:hypothetical protein [Oryza sativa Japonica Group]